MTENVREGILVIGGDKVSAEVRVQPDQDRLVLSRQDAIVDRLIGKIRIAPQLATEIIETPELDVEAL